MMRRWIGAGVGLLLLAGGGCGTVVDVATQQRIYGGTRFDVEMSGGRSLGRGTPDCGPCWLVDLPFSVVMDTALLPVTVVFELARPKAP